MSDTTQIEDDGAAPAEMPGSAVASGDHPASRTDDLDDLLSQWDREVGTSAALEPERNGPSIDDLFDDAVREQERAQLDPQIEALLRGDDERCASETLKTNNEIAALRQGGEAAQQRAAELEGALRQVQYREWQRTERADFDKFAKEAAESISEHSHLPPTYAKDWLIARAAEDPGLRLAFDLRNVDPAKADAELVRVRGAIAELKTLGASAADIAQLEAHSENLVCAIHAKQYLKAALKVLRDQAKASRPIDAQATEDRAAVAQAVRGAGGRVAEEPPPQLGNMSDAEFGKYKQDLGI